MGCKFFGGFPSSGKYLDLVFPTYRMVAYLLNITNFVVRRSHRDGGNKIF
jgi:hypothetical protein